MKPLHLLAIAALVLPFQALAAYSYSYAEFGWRYGELANDEGDGFDLDVNFLLGETLFFSGGIDEIEYDNDLHLDRFNLGIGAHFGAFYGTDIYGVLSYEDIEFDVPLSSDIDDKGWGAELGILYALNDQWEFRAAGKYASYDDDSLDLSSRHFIGSAVYKLSNNYALVGEFIGGELIFDGPGHELDEKNLRIGLRAQF